MSLYLFDTDILSEYQRGHPLVVQNVLSHLSHRLAISVFTVEEVVGGWLRAANQARDDIRRAHAYARLASAVEGFAGFEVLPFSLAAIARHDVLRRQRLNIGGNDLRIASIALESGATVVTRNVRDFRRVVGSNLIDWSI